eukprot:TRINITY_DN4743_c0_g2_i2.p2 TRINITY_DN4743_c0_g2~~TRINITY_DN4743_c0_g2_i2.p2  ORF type:complete len:175 (+),score=10.79 TRINITY_DN4743_c0_g2_i2:60-584(+)
MADLSDLSSTIDTALNDIQQQLRDFISQQQKSFNDVSLGFFYAIDWSEPWILSILSVHVILFLIVIITRKNLTVQGALFFGMMMVVFFAQQLNDLGNIHWKKFAHQPYFDENGFFISMVISLPFVGIMLIIVINYLISLAKLLVKMKRQQLRYEMRKRNEKSSVNGGEIRSKDD